MGFISKRWHCPHKWIGAWWRAALCQTLFECCPCLGNKRAAGRGQGSRIVPTSRGKAQLSRDGCRDHQQPSPSHRSLASAEERHRAGRWHCQEFPGRAGVKGKQEERLLQHPAEEPGLPLGEDLLGHAQPVPEGCGQWEQGVPTPSLWGLSVLTEPPSPPGGAGALGQPCSFLHAGRSIRGLLLCSMRQGLARTIPNPLKDLQTSTSPRSGHLPRGLTESPTASSMGTR